MCIPTIIDASAFGDVLHSRAGADLREWIKRGDGRMVYSDHGGCRNELARSEQMRVLMRGYRQANSVRLVAADSMRAAGIRASLCQACLIRLPVSPVYFSFSSG